MGASLCCCCKKKKRFEEESPEHKKKNYKPTKEFYDMMQKNNVIRMINGDVENKYLAVVQILLECEDVAALFLIDDHNRSGPMFDILKKIFEHSFDPVLVDSPELVQDKKISSDFRRQEFPSRNDIFSRYVYHNNNYDNKTPIDLKELINYV